MRHSSTILQEIAETVASTMDSKTFFLGGERNIIPEANSLIKRITQVEIPRLKDQLQKEIENKEHWRKSQVPRDWERIETEFETKKAGPIKSRLDQLQTLADRLRTLEQDFFKAKTLEAQAAARSKERDFQDRVKNAPNLAAPDPAIADAIYKLRKR